ALPDRVEQGQTVNNQERNPIMSNNDEKYNGWTNYETWNVKLWMDNDEGSYRYWQEIAEEIWEDVDRDTDDFCRKMADRLKDEHEENMPEVQGTYADLLGAALSVVDWYEIAESYLAELPKKEEEEIETE